MSDVKSAPALGEGGSQRPIGQSHAAPTSTIWALRRANERQLRRRRLVERIGQVAGLGGLVELLDELVRHGLVDEAALEDRLAALCRVEPRDRSPPSTAMRSQRSRLMSLPEAAMNRSAPTTQTALRLAETAAWGARPRPRIRLVFWKPIFKGGSNLRGFVTIELPFGLKLIDCSIFVGPNGPWAALPSKPVLGCEGRQARASGKPQFAPVVE